MKPKVSIVKADGRWFVKFSIGVQGFTLREVWTRDDARFLAKMLRKAFKKLEESK